jgi:lysophospholipase L1-like esterase
MMKHPSWRFFFFSLPLLFLAAMLSLPARGADEDAPLLRDGDRVVLLGGTFVERMQTYGYVETVLTALHPEVDITFRNLGWSGDEVSGVARAVFGKTDDGFKRLIDDLTEAKPTVILVAYGANEAYRGPEQVEPFTTGLNRLLDRLGDTSARLLLVTPLRHENPGPPLPPPAEYNQSVAVYRDAVIETAEDRNLPVLDMYSLISSDDPSPAAIDRLTENGLHLTGYGYWRAALHIVKELDLEPPKWTVELDAAGKPREVAGTKLSGVMDTGAGLKFTASDATLPFPPPPKYSPEAASRLTPPRELRITGLAAGDYDVLIDGRQALSADSDELARGVAIKAGPEFSQVERLRREIGKKNELYFHRYRPQNETYLFLFRKHEQGNNAVEIPMFDPLVEQQEALIAKLRRPEKHTYEIKIIRADK